MSTNKFSIVDIDNENDELQFQDFGLSEGSRGAGIGPSNNFTDSAGHQTDSQKLLGEYHDDDEMPPPRTTTDQSKVPSLWTLEYYQRYFDVDTKQVGDRIMWSMVPKPGVSFLERHIKPKPDLYGPFWICLTLVFAAAIAGNVSNYLQTRGELSEYWRYDFHKVSLAACLVFSYGWLVPLLIWCGLRYKSPQPPLSLLHLICLYGYSLAVLVPVCIVWSVPVVWLRWCVGIVAVVLSGLVLCKAVYEGLRGTAVIVDDEETEEVSVVAKKIAIVIVVVVAVLHVAIAGAFMMYFFSEPGGLPPAALAVPTLAEKSPADNVLPAGVLADKVPASVDNNAKRALSPPESASLLLERQPKNRNDVNALDENTAPGVSKSAPDVKAQPDIAPLKPAAVPDESLPGSVAGKSGAGAGDVQKINTPVAARASSMPDRTPAAVAAGNVLKSDVGSGSPGSGTDIKKDAAISQEKVKANRRRRSIN